LDAFSDEQCQGFVRSASRSWGRRGLRVVIQGVVAGAALGATSLLSRWLVEWLGRAAEVWFRQDASFLLTMGVLLFFVLFSTSMAWLMTRNIQLRRAIRWVMNSRGSCASCSYGLTGLPVSGEGEVVCPECGMRLMADGARGEVVVDERGLARFLPCADATPAQRPLRTPMQWKQIRKWTLWTALSLVVLTLALAVGYEGFLRWQASRARGLINTGQTRRALVTENVPGIDPGNPGAIFDTIAELSGVSDRVSEDYWSGVAGTPSGWDTRSVLLALLAPQSRVQQFGAPRAHADVQHAIAILKKLREAGVFEGLDQLRAAGPSVREEPAPNGTWVGYSFDLGLAGVLRLSEINAARMLRSSSTGDEAEWLAAFESNLALARLMNQQAGAMDASVARSVLEGTLAQLRIMVVTRPSNTWANEASGALKRQAFTAPRDLALRGERLKMVGSIAWVFSEPDHVRFGVPSAAIALGAGKGWGWSAPDGRLGTLRDNIDEIHRQFTALESMARLEPYARGPVFPFMVSEYMLVSLFQSPINSFVQALDMSTTHGRAARLLVALEQARAARGAYPESLNELVPEYLEAVPIDTWTGVPLLYRAEHAGEGYTLYAAGADAQNHGGTDNPVPLYTWDAGFLGAGFMSDYVIHRQWPAEAQLHGPPWP